MSVLRPWPLAHSGHRKGERRPRPYSAPLMPRFSSLAAAMCGSSGSTATGAGQAGHGAVNPNPPRAGNNRDQPTRKPCTHANHSRLPARIPRHAPAPTRQDVCGPALAQPLDHQVGGLQPRHPRALLQAEAHRHGGWDARPCTSHGHAANARHAPLLSGAQHGWDAASHGR